MGGNDYLPKARQVAYTNNEPVCQVCGTPDKEYREGNGRSLDVHHMNGDSTDDRPGNLALLCRSCHQKVHYGLDGGNEEIEKLHERLPEEGQWSVTDDDDYKTMRVPAEDWKIAREAKATTNLTWGEWITYPIDNGFVEPPEDYEEDGVDTDELIQKINGRIDDLETEVKSELEELQRP